MFRLMSIILAFILITNVFAQNSQQECLHTAKSFQCVKYVKNYDADTVTFNIPNIHPLIGEMVNIRVRGVDTPEIKTKNQCEKEKARHAKKLVENLFKNAKRIDLQNIERGKYFRIVADVILDGKSLSHYLLKNGLAVSYNGGTKQNIDWCKSTRDIASQNTK